MEEAVVAGECVYSAGMCGPSKPHLFSSNLLANMLGRSMSPNLFSTFMHQLLRLRDRR